MAETKINANQLQSGGDLDEYLKRSSVPVITAEEYEEVTNADEDRTYYAPDGSLVYDAYVDDEISDCIFIVKPKEIDPNLDDDKALDTYVWAVSWIDEDYVQLALVGTDIAIKGKIETDEETGDHRVVYGYVSTPLAVDSFGTVDGMLNITGEYADLGVYNDDGQVDIAPNIISFSSGEDPSVSFQVQPVNDSLIVETSCTNSGVQKHANMKLTSSDVLFTLPADTYIRGNADTEKVDLKRQWKNSPADATFQTETAIWSKDANRIVKCTQADYDALVSAGTVDANTLYLIV